MKTNRTLIAACIAAIFASGAVIAKEKWEYHEEGWEKTKSYGSVTVAQDSVNQWGPWEEFVEPAAGAPSIAFLGAGAGNPYNPIPNPIPPAGGCGAGEWCGYMALSLTFHEPKYDKYWVKTGKHSGYWVYEPRFLDKFAAAEIALQFKPSAGSDPWGGYYDVGGVNLRLLTDLLPYASAGAETGMVPVKFFGQQGKFYEIDPNYKTFDGGNNGEQWDIPHFYINEDYVTLGLLEAYVSGNGEVKTSCYGECGTKVYAPFVAGKLTSLADMSSMSKYNATYDGYTALAGGRVHMDVQFGTATWQGYWNPGLSTNFGASGNISGANFASTSVTGCDVVSGSVKGSFYGPNAAALGGVADVTKTAGYVNGDSVRMIEPTTTRYVDVFAATKTHQYVPKPE